MIEIIVFIVLLLFVASMIVILYTRPKYKHVPIEVIDDLDKMLEEDKKDC